MSGANCLQLLSHRRSSSKYGPVGFASASFCAAADHGFVDGAQHARRASFRQSPYDSTLFFLQSDAAHAARPLSDEQLAAVERALAACAPSASALDDVALHERVERGGARRRLKRSRERRDG